MSDLAGEYRPPSWPKEVPHPGHEDFTTAAFKWLFSLYPDAWHYPVMRERPTILVHWYRHQLLARYETLRHGYRTVRTDLGDVLPPHVLDEVITVYRVEGQRLYTAACALEWVDRAVRGETLSPMSPDAGRWFPAAFWIGSG